MTTAEPPPLLQADPRTENEAHALELLSVHPVLSTPELASAMRYRTKHAHSNMTWIMNQLQKQGLVRQVRKGVSRVPATWALRHYQAPTPRSPGTALQPPQG